MPSACVGYRNKLLLVVSYTCTNTERVREYEYSSLYANCAPEGTFALVNGVVRHTHAVLEAQRAQRASFSVAAASLLAASTFKLAEHHLSHSVHAERELSGTRVPQKLNAAFSHCTEKSVVR